MNSEKKQKIFNYVSIVIILIFGFYYLGRLVYYKILNDKNTNYSSLLAEQIKQRTTKYEIEPTLINENNVYRFANDAKNNYIKFMGYLWRIVKVNENNTITLISEEPVISLSYGEDNYLDSQINKWLNYINEDNTGIFTLNNDYLENTTICLDKFDTIDKASCNETNNDYNISLLSIDDYIKAGGENSYLNNGTHFWTTNTNGNKSWYISIDGKTELTSNDTNHEIRPVITLKNDVNVLDGNGTIDNPYIILNHEPELLKDIYVGEYLKLNDSLWRVVTKDENKIKIVSEEYIKENDTIYQSQYNQYTNLPEINNENGLLYYLNNNYYNNFKEKDFIVEGPFYYGASNNDYTTTYKESINAYVGLLSIAEPFVYDSGNVFTFTRSVNSNSTIFIINEDKKLFEDDINNLHYIRPAIYINNQIKIEKGSGSYLDPYILRGVVDEGN